MTQEARAYICQRVEHFARTRPDATAVVYGDVALSYGQLAARAADLAEELSQHDLPRTAPIMVALPRSPEQIVALLALWRSGLAYLPVDHRDPPQRREEIRTATGAVGTIYQDRTGSRDLAIAVKRPAAAPLAPARTLDVDSAYVIFTSGSTGKPKGVVASHQALSSLIELLTHRYEITPEDRVLQFAAPTFDTALEQIGVTLSAGATLVLPDTLWAPSEFHNRVTSARVTVMDLTPSYWRQVVGHAQTGDLSAATIRLVVLGGAAVSNRDVKDARALYPQARVINAYGLTETGITSCLAEHADVSSLDDGPAAVGHPLDGVSVTILDSAGKPVRPGASGDIAIAGRLALGITRGSRIDPLPTFDSEGRRAYLTGDTGYLHPTRGLIVTGRADRQLKIRGFRVDPAEVENVLRSHPDVDDVAVVSDSPALTIHAWYAVAGGHTDPGSTRLLALARQALPAHAVPSSATAMESLPHTAHGKIDYKLLARKVEAPANRQAGALIGIDSAIEHAVAGIWTDILGIGRDQLALSFFDAGGTSVAAAELVARTRASLGVHVSFVRALIERLLKEPNFVSYCEAVAEARAGALDTGSAPHDVIQADLDRSISLTGQADQAPPRLTEDSTILLTGATGFLGSHLLPRFLASTSARIACLVRAESEAHARQRLRSAWETYGSAPDIPQDVHDRVDIVLGDLTELSLGLTTGAFDALADRTSLVVHSGGTVNFIYPYAEMKSANVDGTFELLRLAAVNGAPFHHVSTMAVIAGHGVAGTHMIDEDAPLDHLDQLGVGYAESKWVAEHLVQTAGRAGLPVAIYRAADISGHSIRGTWNTTTEMCCMKRFIRDIGAIPKAELPMDYTPVDVFADALVHIATHERADGRVYHLTNPRKAHISLLQERLRTRGHDVAEIPWEEWVAKMIDLAVADPKHPMTPFAPLFIDKCPGGQMSVAEMYLEDTFPVFTRTNVERALATTGITFPDVDADLIDRYLHFLERKDFL